MVAQNKTAPAPIDLNNASQAELLAIIEKQRKENEALAAKASAAKKAGAFSARVNEPGKKNTKGEATKGGNVSITGLGRFPVTLYGTQVITLTDPENVLEVITTALAGFDHLSVKEGTEAEMENARKEMKAGLEARKAVYTRLVEALKKTK